MSPETVTRETEAIHYHTTNGKTLTYQLENVASYGISLSPLSSETETVITETVLSEPHVTPTVERTIPLQLSHLPSEIEERMLCCLHSSKEYLSKDINDRDYYVPTSTNRHENLRTVYPNGSCYPTNVDTVVPHNKNREISKNKTGNSTNECLEQGYSEDVFAYGDTEGLEEFVDEKFAVMEEFATVLEESESVFEEVEDYTEELDEYVVTDEEVLEVTQQDRFMESVLEYQPDAESSPDTLIDYFENPSSAANSEVKIAEEIELENERVDAMEESSTVKTPAEPIPDDVEDDDQEEQGVYFEESDDDPEMQEVTYLKFDDDGLTDFPMFEKKHNSEGYNSNSHLESLEEEDEEDEEEEEDEGVDEISVSELTICQAPAHKADTATKEITVREFETGRLINIDMETHDHKDPEPEFKSASSEEQAVSLASNHEEIIMPESTSCANADYFEKHGNYGLLQDQFEETLNVFDKLTSAILQSESVLQEDVEERAGTFDWEEDTVDRSADYPAPDQIAQGTVSSSQDLFETSADPELIDLVRNYVNLVINAPRGIIYPNTLEEDLEGDTHGKPSCQNHVNEEKFLTDKEEDATSLPTFDDTEQVDVNGLEKETEQDLKSGTIESSQEEPVGCKPASIDIEIEVEEVVNGGEPNSSEFWFHDDAGEVIVRSIVDEVMSHALDTVEKLLEMPGTTISGDANFENELHVSADESETSDDSEESFITVIFNPFSLDDFAETTVPLSASDEDSSQKPCEQNMALASNESESAEQNEHGNNEQRSNPLPDSEEELSTGLTIQEKPDDVAAKPPVCSPDDSPVDMSCNRLIIEEMLTNALDDSQQMKNSHRTSESEEPLLPDSINPEDSDVDYSGVHTTAEKWDFGTTNDSVKNGAPTKSMCTVEPWSSITVKRESRESSPDFQSEGNPDGNYGIGAGAFYDSETEMFRFSQQTKSPVTVAEEPTIASSSLDFCSSDSTSDVSETKQEEEEVKRTSTELDTGFTVDYHVLAFYIHEEEEDDCDLPTSEVLVQSNEQQENVLRVDPQLEDDFGEAAGEPPEPGNSDPVPTENENETFEVPAELAIEKEHIHCVENSNVFEEKMQVFDEHVKDEMMSPETTSLQFAQESVVQEETENTFLFNNTSNFEFESADLKNCSVDDDDDVFEVLHFVVSNVEFYGIEDHQMFFHTGSPFEKDQFEEKEEELIVLEATNRSSHHCNKDAVFEYPVAAGEDAGQESDNNTLHTSLAQEHLATDRLFLESSLEPCCPPVPVSHEEIIEKEAELDCDLTSIETMASELVKEVLENVANSLAAEVAESCIQPKETQSEQPTESRCEDVLLETTSSANPVLSCQQLQISSPGQVSTALSNVELDLDDLEGFASSLAKEIVETVLQMEKPQEVGRFAEYDDDHSENRNEVLSSLGSVSEVMEHSIDGSETIEAERRNNTLKFGSADIIGDVFIYPDGQHNLVDNWMHSLVLSITSEAVEYASNFMYYQDTPGMSGGNMEHDNGENEIVQSLSFSSQETTLDSQTRDANDVLTVVESVFYQETLDIFDRIDDCTISAATKENSLEHLSETVPVFTEPSSPESPAFNEHCALEMNCSSASTFPVPEVFEQAVRDFDKEYEYSKTSDVKSINNHNSNSEDEELEFSEEEKEEEEELILGGTDFDAKATERDEFAADSDLNVILERSQLISNILDMNRNHQAEKPQENSFEDDYKSQSATWEAPASLSTSASHLSTGVSTDDQNFEEHECQADEELNAVLETSALISSILECANDEKCQPHLESSKAHNQNTLSSCFNPQGSIEPLNTDARTMISCETPISLPFSQDSEISNLLSEMITSLEAEEITLSPENIEGFQCFSSIQQLNIPVTSEHSVVNEEYNKTNEVPTTGLDRTVGENKREISETTILATESVNNCDLSHDVTSRGVRVNSEDVSGLDSEEGKQEFNDESTHDDADSDKLASIVKSEDVHGEAVVENNHSLQVGGSGIPAQPGVSNEICVTGDDDNSVKIADSSFVVVCTASTENVEEENVEVESPSLNEVHVLETPTLSHSFCNIPEPHERGKKEEDKQEHTLMFASEEQEIGGLSVLSHPKCASQESAVPVFFSHSLGEPAPTTNLNAQIESCDHSSCFDTPETTLQPAVETRFTSFPEGFESSCSTSAMTMTSENQSILLPHYQFPPCKQKIEDLVDQDPHVSNVPISVVSTSSEPLSTVSDAVPENSSLRDPSTTESSFNHPEPIETSSVVEEVSYLLTTVCIAALAFVPLSESRIPFNSDIIEDASKYFSTDPKPEPKPEPEQDAE